MEDVTPYGAGKQTGANMQVVRRKIRFVKVGVHYSCLVELAFDVDSIAFQLGTRLAMSKRNKKGRFMRGAIRVAVHSITQEP